jgi:hypothetical protein
LFFSVSARDAKNQSSPPPPVSVLGPTPGQTLPSAVRAAVWLTPLLSV